MHQTQDSAQTPIQCFRKWLTSDLAQFVDSLWFEPGPECKLRLGKRKLHGKTGAATIVAVFLPDEIHKHNLYEG